MMHCFLVCLMIFFLLELNYSFALEIWDRSGFLQKGCVYFCEPSAAWRWGRWVSGTTFKLMKDAGLGAALGECGLGLQVTGGPIWVESKRGDGTVLFPLSE